MSDSPDERDYLLFTQGDPVKAWPRFLRRFAPEILRTVRLFERDSENQSDCFVFVCEELRRRNFRRLRAYKPQEKARFSDWLKVVVYNLCRDFYRKRFGRRRTFRAVRELPLLEQAVFRCIFEERLTPNEAQLSLSPMFPQLNSETLDRAVTRIASILTPRQRRLLDTRKPTFFSLDGASAESEFPLEATGESPEEEAYKKERAAELERALKMLTARERFVLALRYEQELTLQEIARLISEPNAQKVDRLIRASLEKLRREIPD